MRRTSPTLACVSSVALLMLLCGCAIFTETYGIQDVDNWAAKNEPLAEAGKMKWSEFYSLYLEKVSATPVINNSPVVERLGIMVTASLFYERGRIDKAAFDSVQGIVRKYQTIDDPAANLLARNALVKAIEKAEPGGPARKSEPDR
ncbi:MAG TPA: hypothetical protein VE008_12560 [Burkholderiales bacterium]|nr:hypothetical protein [Burkholderiales bacterium]